MRTNSVGPMHLGCVDMINVVVQYRIAAVCRMPIDNFDGPTQDYTFAALTFEHEGFYGTYGTFSQDFDGSYLELGYGTTISEIDFGISLILANDDLVGNDDESLIFTIGKSFDL
jgi:hypothetical protein